MDAPLRPAPAWGHTSGLLELQAPDGPGPDGALRAVLAESVHRYGWAYDERRADLLAGAFTADGVWEASIMGETAVGPFTGRAAITAWLADFWPQQSDQRRHVFTNVVVESVTETAGGEGSATVVAYLILLASAEARTHIETAGFYRFTLRREPDGVWRIEHLFAGFDAPF